MYDEGKYIGEKEKGGGGRGQGGEGGGELTKQSIKNCKQLMVTQTESTFTLCKKKKNYAHF